MHAANECTKRGTYTHMLARSPRSTRYVPVVTGPGAVKVAMIHFMNAFRFDNVPNATLLTRFQKVRAGTYVGMDNATVRVVGHRGNENQYVCRSCVQSKGAGFQMMDIQHFSRVKPVSNQEACVNRFYKRHEWNETDW